ncbi:MAG: dihydropteroate synthase [Prolixibacteraceae bacterium]|nr:dihydropteroate synthase [Burkholderiales bacterium]
MSVDESLTAPHASHFTPHATLRLGRFSLSLERPLIMAIVNITPDSFSDGGRFFDCGRAFDHARKLLEEGADILDVGGESSRPGARPVTADEELRRVLPVLEKLVELPVPVSVDTSKPEVMRRAIAAGAAMINDITALREEGALDAVSGSKVAVCLMHMQGEPRTMQQAPQYRDVVEEVKTFLANRAAAAIAAGVERNRIVLDPGFGFGKTMQHNLELIRALPRLRQAGYPLLAGLSRKALFGKIVGRERGQRVYASAAGAVLAAQRGASIVRVHDVAATRDCLLVLRAIDDTTYSLS